MSIKKYFVHEGYKKMQIDEYLAKEFEKAGYAGMEIYKTPLGMRITIYAERPGLIIGRGGQTIKKLAETLEKRFGVERPQIAIAQIQTPELNAKVMALRIARAMEKGVNFRRAAFVALRQIMEAGARGAEIIISGKLRSERANYEKVKAGELLKVGEKKELYVDEGKAEILLKPGKYGIKVRIMPPVKMPDEIMIKEKIEEKEVKEIGDTKSG
ncbi:MAG: 30S ribosomal protein S3 [Candidatus Methanomethylicia archaeon]|nr:30S ribosomal protein S3 [Candidatus Methanomethylicia archaeon]MCX8168947.1 30S ribosomal protein S3 [Candidatus Methanomethylicia archaeon]MDW7988679.1 30S ribosomal protein S3 [Nitrososphaerota archaeon]